MIKIYPENGLPFYDDNFIRWREHIVNVVSCVFQQRMREQNRAWLFHRVEAPCLVPTIYVNSGYADEAFHVDDLVLKPETTGSSYEYARYLIEHQLATPPLCVWQHSKSFRRENEQVTANVRLKEFYQLEFQCIVTEDTKNNYQETMLQHIADLVKALLGLDVRVIESDRLPHYSKKTMDIEVKTPHKWLEVMSCSLRNDVPFEWEGRKLINYEFAFGSDRLTYARKG